MAKEEEADKKKEQNKAESSNTSKSEVGVPIENIGNNTGDKNDAPEADKAEDAPKTVKIEEGKEIVDPNVGTLKPRSLTEEMQKSYLDYAMSVIVSRALPDVRDGMKPVHRRVLYAMYSTGLRHNTKYRKSAKVVGEVIGNYHPHGDVAVYETLVRMAQDFSMRYIMVDGQGNFGSMDGDSAAAMRYTECRMSAISEEMLQDIDKDTVDWQDNYDGSIQEPQVLPAKTPQLLLNGTMGIAVGMATNIPPHNLTELATGINHLIDNPECEVDDLMEYIKGPDFPTGGIIYNKEDIKTAYATGKGKIVMRAKTEIEEVKKGFRILVHEIPYQVNKSTLIEKIADLVKNKKIDGISDIRDESDRHGVRVVIELKSSAFPKKVLNLLYEHTSLQTAFHVNMLALTPELEPRVMTLKDMLKYFIAHRQDVITRRTKFELRKAQDRAHILEGLKIALDNIDQVIDTIKKSANRDVAKVNLMKKFKLSEKQADAILDMRLSSLAALEREKIEQEYKEILARISYLEDLLARPEKILGLIKEDLKYVTEKYGDERRTKIVVRAIGDFSAEDLIPNEHVVVALSRGNYIKRQDVTTYRKQMRGGKGVVGMTTKEEDIVDHLVSAYTHDDIFFFTNKGRVFKSKVYELPATSRQSKGTPVVNIIQIGPNEKVTSLLMVPKNGNGDKYFIMGTRVGMIKRTEITKYDNIRKTGIIAMGLRGDDELRWVKTSKGKDVIVEVTEKGLAICYSEEQVRAMGRSASGVRGMKLKTEDRVMSLDVIDNELAIFEGSGSKYSGPDMLVVLENGFGKRTMLKHFHLQKRGGMGIRAANITSKTGNLIGIHITYSEEGDVVLASKKGQFIRVDLKSIKRLGRDTQGVTLMRMKSGDKVSSVAMILPEKEDAISDTPEKEGEKELTEKAGSKVSASGEKKEKVSSKEEKKVKLSKKVEKKSADKADKKEPKISIKKYDDKKVVGKSETKDKKQPLLNISSYDSKIKVEEIKEDKKTPAPRKPKDDINYWGGQTS